LSGSQTACDNVNEGSGVPRRVVEVLAGNAWCSWMTPHLLEELHQTYSIPQ